MKYCLRRCVSTPGRGRRESDEAEVTARPKKISRRTCPRLTGGGGRRKIMGAGRGGRDSYGKVNTPSTEYQALRKPYRA